MATMNERDEGKKDKKNILVTGGAGFVGATLVRMLAAAGHRVLSLDNYVTGNPSYLAGVEGVELAEADIGDPAALDRLMVGREVVVHLAAAGNVVESVQDPVANFKTNVVGTLNVLEAARKAGVERVVLASTGGALIGNAPTPVNEHSLPKPISPYGAGKAACEAYAHAYAYAYGLRTVTLRFANVCGPWSKHKKGAMTTFFNRLHEDKPIVIYGDGSSTRDYIHVDDVARALQLAVEKDGIEGGTVLHISSGVETTVRRLAEVCCMAAGKPNHPIHHQETRPGEVERNFASYELAHQVLGWSPTISLEETVRRTWGWYCQHVFSS